MYQVVVERSAEKDLKRLSPEIRSRVANVLRSLATKPRPVGSRKLAGTQHDWRVRIGDYRIIYVPGEPGRESGLSSSHDWKKPATSQGASHTIP